MIKRIVIGTAGHVDHGKTTLIQALTGVNTDRLAEEKSRGISIELGFAPLTLKPDLIAGIVDVPGHEKFIKTMLAGVAGIDMVLLVIAADEGIMPQTTEHLDIIRLLGIEKGIIVLSKIDLVDAEWQAFITEEITEALQDTPFAQAPILPVSATTGQGIPELHQAITKMAETIQPRSAEGKPRMPIDRSFIITGFGTVATGTLWSGTIHMGDYLTVYPSQKTARVRSLQAHGKSQQQCQAGQRAAINLAGLELSDVPRGGWLAEEGLLKPSHRLDVTFSLLPSAKTLAHHTRLRIHHGTQEVLGRIHFLDREELQPGETCYAQLTLETPIPPLRGDRLVLRSYSPMTTIAGATVIDIDTKKLKRYHPEIMAALAQKAQGNPADLLLQALEESKEILLSAATLQKQCGLSETEFTTALQERIQQEQIVALPEGFFASAYRLEKQWQTVETALQRFHQQYPLRTGLPKEEFRNKYFSQAAAKAVNQLLLHWQQQNRIQLTNNTVALADFTPKPSPALQAWREKTEKALYEAGFAPPAWHTLLTDLPETEPSEVLPWLISCGQVVKLQEDMVFHQAKLQTAQKLALAELEKNQELSLGTMRNLLQTSRKYALAILEYLDQQKITKRQGDIRVKYDTSSTSS